MKSYAVALLGLATLVGVAHSQTSTVCQPLDVVFVIDNSGSIRDNNDADCQNQPEASCDNWRRMRNFVMQLIDDIAPNAETGGETRFGAVSFGNEGSPTRMLFDLTSDRNAARDTINTTPHEFHSTATAEGIEIMRNDVFNGPNDRPSIPNVAIIITDGVPTRPEGNPIQAAIDEANAAKADDIYILTVGVTSNIDEETIRSLSSPAPGENEPVSS